MDCNIKINLMSYYVRLNLGELYFNIRQIQFST